MNVRRTGLFGAATFLLGWMIQMAVAIGLPAGFAAPHVLFLLVMALGVSGRTTLAQNLGFFWGLALDVTGLSLFGSQGLLLAWAGAVAGRLSRQLNADKLVTQETLAVAGTLVFQVAMAVLDSVFRGGPSPRPLSLLTLVLQMILNGLAAPILFWGIQAWAAVWARLEDRGHLAHAA
jgi:rod shape-determining protein MreD